ncbi:MAG: hypothetical protein QF858_01775 [Candidatus Pacebacteria bacterium]|jgi:hypothetical protein|nr:hypothetical protein [bacterium]MDP6527591.1 hypothetical protein [Candidatus Paceibacterota bacterium]
MSLLKREDQTWSIRQVSFQAVVAFLFVYLAIVVFRVGGVAFGLPEPDRIAVFDLPVQWLLGLLK